MEIEQFLKGVCPGVLIRVKKANKVFAYLLAASLWLPSTLHCREMSLCEAGVLSVLAWSTTLSTAV